MAWGNGRFAQASYRAGHCGRVSIRLMYKQLYEDVGWLRVDKPYNTNSGGKRIESLWLSPIAQRQAGMG